MTKDDINSCSDSIDIKMYLIGCAISDIRNKQHISIEYVSECLQIPVEDLELYENGLKDVDVETLFKLSRLFKVRVSYFFEYCNNI
jgi:predicted transcriptional regulator